MFYHQRIENCFHERIGDAGIRKAELDTLLARLDPAFSDLKNKKNAAANPLLALPFKMDDVGDIETLARQWRKRFKHVVVIGAGGSGLSGRVLAALKPALAPVALHFLDNIDPDSIDRVLALPAGDTGYIVVSKSGSTVETLAHFYVLFEHARGVVGAKKASEHFVVITMNNNNPLKQSTLEHAIKTIDHAADIGGRFSVFTAVGLLPAAIAGIDIRALREGAAAVVKQMDNATHANECPPATGAALQYAFLKKGHNISVMLPYAERLSGFSSWYRQSWAESVGKGGKGSTPIHAVGSTDQHSQLQLYLDGPKDKLFHVITLARAGSGQKILSPVDYLQRKTTGDIMAAEQRATIETLIKNYCPVRLIELDKLTESSLGALIMHFTLEIIFMAALLEVNPFDQPAVEEGKQLARDYLLSGQL